MTLYMCLFYGYFPDQESIHDDPDCFIVSRFLTVLLLASVLPSTSAQSEENGTDASLILKLVL